MRLTFFAPLFLAASFVAFAQTALPRMASVEPQNAKVGESFVVTGENLQKDVVSKVYLTDGTVDTLVEVVEQTPTTIKFKIPAKCKPGRLAVMILTAGKEPKLIEQPVKVTIDEP